MSDKEEFDKLPKHKQYRILGLARLRCSPLDECYFTNHTQSNPYKDCWLGEDIQKLRKSEMSREDLIKLSEAAEGLGSDVILEEDENGKLEVSIRKVP